MGRYGLWAMVLQWAMGYEWAGSMGGGYRPLCPLIIELIVDYTMGKWLWAMVYGRPVLVSLVLVGSDRVYRHDTNCCVQNPVTR